MTALPGDRTPSPLPHGRTANRPRWAALPDEVRTSVATRLGSPVVAADSAGAGFTAGFASRLRMADGTRAFLKAVSLAANPVIHASYREEARIAAALPPGVPAPRLLWSADVEDWVVLAFVDVESRQPRRPWVPDELSAVLDVLPVLAAELTPAPAGLELPRLADEAADLTFWQDAAGGGSGAPDAPVTVTSHVDELARLESGWAAATAGDTMLHVDLRDDNVLLTPTGQTLVCDWNWPALGPVWFDLVALLISVHGDGLDADALLAAHPLAAGADPGAVDGVLAALAGMWSATADRPLDFPASPWLRAHQAWCRDATLSWLAARRGW